MYRVYARSKIVVHIHEGDVSGHNIGARRVFEASGMGALLLNDACSDLHDFFEPGKEVVTYDSAADCADKIRYYLNHEDERAAIAKQGQLRTLQCHSFDSRAKELLSIFEKHL